MQSTSVCQTKKIMRTIRPHWSWTNSAIWRQALTMIRSCVEAGNAAVCRKRILSTIKSPTIAFAREKGNHNSFLACLALRRMRILRKIRSLLRKIRSLLRKFRIRQIRFGMAPATNKRQCRSVRAETPRTKKVCFLRVRCLHGLLYGGLLDGLLHGGLSIF